LTCGGGKNVALLQNIQTSSGAHLTSFSVGTGWLFFLRFKWPGHEAALSHPLRTMVKNMWNYTTSPPWCGQGQLSLLLHCICWSFSQRKHYFTQQNDILLMLATCFSSTEVSL